MPRSALEGWKPRRAYPCGSPERSVGGSLSWTDSPWRQRRDRRDSFSNIAHFLQTRCGAGVRWNDLLGDVNTLTSVSISNKQTHDLFWPRHKPSTKLRVSNGSVFSLQIPCTRQVP